MTQLYAIVTGGCIALLFLVRTLIRLCWLFKPSNILLRKHILYPFLLRRHRLLGPWTRAQVAYQVIYLAANIFCTCFKVSTASDAATRAGFLSLINMVPAYFGLHLSFICTLLGVSLPSYQVFHRSIGTISVLLSLLHTVINAVGRPLLGIKESKQVFELTVSQCIPNKSILS